MMLEVPDEHNSNEKAVVVKVAADAGVRVVAVCETPDQLVEEVWVAGVEALRCVRSGGVLGGMGDLLACRLVMQRGGLCRGVLVWLVFGGGWRVRGLGG